MNTTYCSPHHFVRLVCVPAVVVVAGCAGDAVSERTSAQEASSAGVALPIPDDPLQIPDTPLAEAARQLLEEAAPPYLYNHSVRTYLFGAAMLRAQQRSFDEETAFVASVLHDLGLVPEHMTPDQPFEVDGADAAVSFLQQYGAPPEQVQLVWEAIALHTNAPIARRKAPEVALVNAGAGVEATGFGYELLAARTVSAVLEAYPRRDFKQRALAGMIELCRTKPQGVLLHPFAEVGRRHLEGFSLPTAEDLLLNSPFDE